MLTYMLDTNICIYVMKTYPPGLREKLDNLAEQLCISSITLGELYCGVEKSARRAENLTAIEHFAARLEVLPLSDKAAVHYGQIRAEEERAGTPCGPNDMQIGGHARSEGPIVVPTKCASLPGCGATRGKLGVTPAKRFYLKRSIWVHNRSSLPVIGSVAQKA